MMVFHSKGASSFAVHDRVLRLRETTEVRRPLDISHCGACPFQSRGSVLSDALDSRSFILGDNFSAADIMLAHSFLWLEDRAVLGSFPILDDYLERMFSRPAVERAMTG